MDSTQTTVTAAAAGGAAGIVVTWLIGLLGSVDVPGEVGGAISVLGTFTFGLIFPR